MIIVHVHALQLHASHKAMEVICVFMPCNCRQLVSYMKEHFRDDERGRQRAFYFWPWHFNFFCR